MRWLTQLFSRRGRYDELSESIREHLDEKIEDMIDRGHDARGSRTQGPSRIWQCDSD